MNKCAFIVISAFLTPHSRFIPVGRLKEVTDLLVIVRSCT